MPYSEFDSISLEPARQDAILTSAGMCSNWQKCHPDKTLVPMGIGAVLGPTGEPVTVPLVEEFRQKLQFTNSYIPQSQISAYLDGVAADFGFKPDEVARIGTLGATGAVSAALSFLRQGCCLQGFSGYGLASGLKTVRPVDSWDNLDAMFGSHGISVAKFRLHNRRGEVCPGQLEMKLAQAHSGGNPVVLYLQTDSGNMSGYYLPHEVRQEIVRHCAKFGTIVLLESLYRGTSAKRTQEIESAYVQDIALVWEFVNAGVPLFITHSESKRGNFSGRVGVLLHVPRRKDQVPAIQSQLFKMARVSGYWFLPETFLVYEQIYRKGAAEGLHRDIQATTVKRIVQSSEENLAYIPNGKLKEYWQNLRGLTRIVPVREGAAERLLLKQGIGTVVFDQCETDAGPAVRLNTTGNLSANGRRHMKKLWNAVAAEFRPFVML